MTTPSRDQDKKKWLESRKESVGSSEIVTILGLNDFESPLELYNRKVGDSQEIEDNLPMAAGRALEPLILEDVRKDFLLRDLEIRENGETFSCGSLMATPDGIISIEGEDVGILEIKTTANFDKWKEGVADYAYLQTMWQMGVLGLERGWVAAVIGGRFSDVKVFEVKWDEEIWKMLVFEASAFIQKVMLREPPLRQARDVPIYQLVPGEVKDLSEDVEAVALSSKISSLRAKQKPMNAEVKLLKTEEKTLMNQLLDLIKGAEKTIIGEYSVNIKHIVTKPSKGREYDRTTFKG